MESQESSNNDELLDLCPKDRQDLPDILSKAHQVTLRRYNRSVIRYASMFFDLANEIEQKSIWAYENLAQQHRKRLGFAEEKFDPCRKFAYQPYPFGIPFSMIVKAAKTTHLITKWRLGTRERGKRQTCKP